MKIDIKKYADYFHDGDVREVYHKKNETILVMDSAQLLPEWNVDNIILSKRETISGKLHIIGINRVMEDGKRIECFKIKDSYAIGNVHSFKVHTNKILLQIWWIRYPYEESDTYEYEIAAEKIYWENIPELSDQFWAKITGKG